MGLSVKRTSGGFQKVVFENVVDTLAGGVILAGVDPADYPNGVVPEGSLIGKNLTTGAGSVQEEPDATTIGLLYRDSPVDDNTFAGVVIEGVARIKALPQSVQDNLAAIKTALPKITFV